jgi:hypothetical protein
LAEGLAADPLLERKKGFSLRDSFPTLCFSAFFASRGPNE